MPLNARELALIRDELWPALEGDVVQKLFAHLRGQLWLSLRGKGRSTLLHLVADSEAGRIAVVDGKPPGEAGVVPPFQQVLRRELSGKALTAFHTGERGLSLRFEKGGQARTVWLWFGSPPALVCVAEGEVPRVLAVSSPLSLGPELRPGQPFTAPNFAAERAEGEGALPRLPTAGPGAFPLGRAAGLLFEQAVQQRVEHRVRSPLLTALKRLERTRAKVEEDLQRAGAAAEHKLLGTALTHAQPPPHAPTAAVTLYRDDGSQEARTVTRDKGRSWKQQAEWHFHQYKRLTRGAELAAQRLLTLDAEAARLRAELEAPVEADASADTLVTPKNRPARALPYKEYYGHNGCRILVGRGGSDNDTLTFRIARPHDLWLHVRGAPGAHVIIPLERNQTAGQELLLDAAHLALHHSTLKGETRAEISCVPVKNVRKTKGSAGAVQYSGEKTMALRVDPARLMRLLAPR